MKLIVDIPDASKTLTFVLRRSSSVDDAENVVSHISRHFKNLQVHYKVMGTVWDGTMLTSSSDNVSGLDDLKCIKGTHTSVFWNHKS